MTKTYITHAVMHAWMKRGWLTRLLLPLAWSFGAVIKLRAFLYRIKWLQQKKLAVPVIVVGNIFVGGTGKTPFTLWLLKQLQYTGYKPGVISRGYGRKHEAPCVVVAQSKAVLVGDEPILLAQQSSCPVVVGRDRIKAGQLLLANFPEVNVIIADDGLQHMALARNVEIMLFDTRGIGNGWLLPAGPLREPVTRRRDITVANLNAVEEISVNLPKDTVRMQLKGTFVQQLLDATQKRDLSSFDKEITVIAAAGIGYPERFFAMLRQQGVKCSELPLPDHYEYLNNPFEALTADMILITEKDAVKCRQLKNIATDPRIWVVVVEVEVDVDVIEKIIKKLN
ncbi:MAG: lpxK [Solimicrobium sp.]|jgi:tetraacyldisaccharide 4'-kinase|nr:lpxK [Solimicrobium sp.]